MTENQKKQLEQQLWNVANQLRGKMHADVFTQIEKMETFKKVCCSRCSCKFLFWWEKSPPAPLS